MSSFDSGSFVIWEFHCASNGIDKLALDSYADASYKAQIPREVVLTEARNSASILGQKAQCNQPPMPRRRYGHPEVRCPGVVLSSCCVRLRSAPEGSTSLAYRRARHERFAPVVRRNIGVVLNGDSSGGHLVARGRALRRILATSLGMTSIYDRPPHQQC